MPASPPTDDRPNVLLILTDDQGWDDLSCHGNRHLSTPNLDRLAGQSVRFSNYYVAAVCAPSRASLLTGRHFLRTGVSHVHGGKDYVHPDEVMISQLFRAAGYRTGMWGKWHSGKTTGYRPHERGFEEAYHARLYKHLDSEGRFNGQPRRHTGWTTETLADYAIDFLERHRDQPFFAFVSHLAPHGPLRAPDELVARHQAKGLSRALSTVYAMVEQIDRSVGRVLDRLDELGLTERTIVLFMSDNGPACLERELTDEDRRIRNVNGYKGHKGNMWERGIKSPLFVRWPGRFRPHTVGRVCDICDILPTLADLCGVDLPADLPPLDGRSVRSYLEGDESSLPPKESYVYVSPGWPPDPEAGYSADGRFGEYEPVPPETKGELGFCEQLVSLRDEQYKLLRNPGPVENMPEAVPVGELGAVPDPSAVGDLDASRSAGDARGESGKPPETPSRQQAAAVGREVLIHITEDPREDRNIVRAESATAEAMRGKLRDWFEGIKAEPHSFHAPTFVVGPSRVGKSPSDTRDERPGLDIIGPAEGALTRAGEPTNVVMLYAPVRTRGRVRNGGLASIGWRTPGDGADYHLRVTEAGTYALRLDTRDVLPPATDSAPADAAAQSAATSAAEPADEPSPSDAAGARGSADATGSAPSTASSQPAGAKSPADATGSESIEASDSPAFGARRVGIALRLTFGSPGSSPPSGDVHLDATLERDGEHELGEVDLPAGSCSLKIDTLPPAARLTPAPGCHRLTPGPRCHGSTIAASECEPQAQSRAVPLRPCAAPARLLTLTFTPK